MKDLFIYLFLLPVAVLLSFVKLVGQLLASGRKPGILHQGELLFSDRILLSGSWRAEVLSITRCRKSWAY